MGLIEQTIKELRQMDSMVTSGKANNDEIKTRLEIYRQVGEQAKLALSIYAMAAKFGDKHLNRVARTGLIGDEAVLDDRDIVIETIFCPDQDMTITRRDCKTYSSESGHLSTCQTCKNFKITRRLLSKIDKEPEDQYSLAPPNDSK